MLVIVVSDIANIEYLLNKCSYQKEYGLKMMEIYKASYCDIDFLIVVTGYGKVNIGSALAHLVNKYQVSEIINLGIVSSVRSDIDLLEAVIAKRTIQFDVDFNALGNKDWCLPNQEKSVFWTDNMLSYLLEMACIHCDIKSHKGLIGTSDSFITNYNKANYLRETLNMSAVDNDSGSVGQFCFNHNIPFSSLKIVSNYANGNGICQYRLNNEEANVIGNRLILKFIKEYYHK